MQKPRSKLSAIEIDALHERVAERLERIGVQTQPEVALKVLNLSSRPDTHPKDYAQVIKNDPGLSGRLLKLANSAMFAQRKPVTSIDRACLVLGLERLKSIALGFHLSRAASSGGTKELARQVWGQSVYRACLASELARHTAPSLVPEAFVIGLMLDAGIPLMSRLVGPGYDALYASCDMPLKLFRNEFETLEFTHVDVLSALMRLWRLPDLLARPLEWHHDRPSASPRPDPVHRLHRIAYVAGSLQVATCAESGEAQPLTPSSPGVPAAQRLLELDDNAIATVVRRAGAEYGANIDLFSEIASSMGCLDDVLETIQLRLVRAIDDKVEESIRHEHTSRQRFSFCGQSIELAREGVMMVAYLYDSTGAPLVTHRFQPAVEDPPTVLAALGVEPQPCEELDRMYEFIRTAA
ncbi:MAG: HDOD domain-containing protein [Phycisphaerales bacterium]